MSIEAMFLLGEELDYSDLDDFIRGTNLPLFVLSGISSKGLSHSTRPSSPEQPVPRRDDLYSADVSGNRLALCERDDRCSVDAASAHGGL